MIVETLRRALSDTVRGQIVALFMLVAGGGLSLLYLFVTESPTVAAEEIPYASGAIFGAFGALVLLFVWNLACAPYRLQKERADKAEKSFAGEKEKRLALEARETPKLAFSYRAEDNKNLEVTTINKGGRNVERLLGRVAVKNTSRVATIERVSVTLVHYMKDGFSGYRTIDQRLFSNASGQPVADIDAWREENFNLFRAKASPTPGSGVALGPFAAGNGVSLGKGKFRLKVTASGRDVASVPQFYFLGIPENGEIEFRPWKEGDTDHVGPPLQA